MDIKILTPRREQVKVLLVLYDGGSHAKDVSYPVSFCHLN